MCKREPLCPTTNTLLPYSIPRISVNSISLIWFDVTSLDSSSTINYSIAYSTLSVPTTLLFFEGYQGLCTGYHLCLKFSSPGFPHKCFSQVFQLSTQLSLSREILLPYTVGIWVWTMWVHLHVKFLQCSTVNA